MGPGPIDRILDLIRGAGDDLLIYGGSAVVVLLILAVAWKILTSRRRAPPPRVPDLAIDLASLPAEGPPATGPVLEHYNLPVRLAVVVLAPTGRSGELPPIAELARLIDHIVPGLAQVAEAHRPLIRRWPSQLSSEGFAHTFFSQVRLPGDGGKGTPWCAVAGKFKVQRRWLMAGLVMRAESDNNFSQSIVHQEHQWLAILRVKSG
jgi:hypothetical protein